MSQAQIAMMMPFSTVVSRAIMPFDRLMKAKAKTAPSTSEDPMSDLLVQVSEQRDRTAFIGLFEHFAPRVKSYLLRLGAKDGEAEDLMQEVMLTVWNRAHQYDRSKARASTWIFTISRNKRIDAIRRERRPEIDLNDPALVSDGPDEPDRALEASEWSAVVKRAIAEIPTEQAELLKLSFFEEKSHDAIAKELNLPLGTVKSRIRLAVSKLRRNLEDYR